ncbi:S8 family serine peptidase [Armatimonas sp.]|uniref:S8 family peptidase n=1 Tax=Armatimonas sp. TaxID=1872638 RepID=UPI00286A27CA|nr:S8 family serine peptidase [Armatimonas sp.]
MTKSLRNTLATLGIAVAVGATAVPMLSVWTQKESYEPIAYPTQISNSAKWPMVLVDFNDGTSDADIQAFAAQYGLKLAPNSIEAKDNRLYRVIEGKADLNALRNDSHVQAAEPEIQFHLEQTAGASAAFRVTDPTVETTTMTDPTVHEELQVGWSSLEIHEATKKQVQATGKRLLYLKGSVPTFQEAPNEDLMLRSSIANISDQARRYRQTGVIDPPTVCTFSATQDALGDLEQRAQSYREAVIAEARKQDAEAAQPSGTRPNDPMYDKQWNFRMIDTEGAWERTRGKGAVVAVIDTGVTQARDFKQTAFTAGYNFVSKTTNADDDHGHGTHVAGTIAESTNNNEGVAGIAFEATIMPLKVLSAEGSGNSADIADAIRFAADKGANIINMSLGSMYPSDVIHEACKYARKKGVTIVCAAGNSFREGVGYPAAFPECIAVSSVGPSGMLSKFSSWGKQVALAAPGGDMIDSRNPDDGILQNSVLGGQDDYFAFQGTSMASPHVAGAAALAYSQGTKDPAKILDLLKKTASKPKENNVKKYGAGILNVGKLTAKAEAENGWKLRNTLAIAFAGLLLAFGGPLGRRNVLLRATTGAAIAGGFFLPDAVTNFVGADSAWNLLSFSALAPALLVWMLRKGPGLKVASGAALGFGVNLFANWNNATIPFTTATFGASALPWTLTNMAVALGLAVGSAFWAAKRLR